MNIGDMFKEHYDTMVKACEGLNTDWELLNYPTRDREASDFTSGHAIDIAYKCPKCEAERASTWLFPDKDMYYQDECCGEFVRFVAEAEEE
jgi:hypothetical protein